jgi:Flp pilus assembly protein TadD
MICWTALEHLLEATRLSPEQGAAWELLADILLARGQPNQAHDCYLRAQKAGAGPDVPEKLAKAASEGYLL